MRSHRLPVWPCSGLLCAAMLCGPVHAWTINVASGPPRLFLQVGIGSQAVNNGFRNRVSVNVPVSALGNGTPLRMDSDSTQTTSSLTNSAVCSTAQQQVYMAAAYRARNQQGAAAQLRVAAPPHLSTPGGDAIPISEVSWTSSHAMGGVNIPDGTFTGSSQLLGSLAPNGWIESCLTFYYRNSAIPAGGTYTATAVFTLAAP